MKKFNVTVPVAASSPLVANQKKAALEKLAAAFPAKTLHALADKGPDLLNGSFSGLIREHLGI